MTTPSSSTTLLPNGNTNTNNYSHAHSQSNGNDSLTMAAGSSSSSASSASSSQVSQPTVSALDELDDPAPGLRPLNRARAQSEVRSRPPFHNNNGIHTNDTNGTHRNSSLNNTNTNSNNNGGDDNSNGGGTHLSAAAHSATTSLLSSRGLMMGLHSGSGHATPITSISMSSSTSSSIDVTNSASHGTGPSLSSSSSSLSGSQQRGSSMPRSSSHRHMVNGVTNSHTIDDGKERKRQSSSSSSRSRERGHSFASNSGDDHSSPGTPINSGGGFECNICLDQSREPVTTLCGHLFCWPCLWRWLEDCPQPGR
jgi:hypothetical protein